MRHGSNARSNVSRVAVAIAGGLAFLVGAATLPAAALAESERLTRIRWIDPNPPQAEVVAYKVFVGFRSGLFTERLEIPAEAPDSGYIYTHDLIRLADDACDTPVFVRMAAVNAEGERSEFSNRVEWPIPVDDQDDDGIPDVCDNCILAANADQLDDDGDGFGNRCDGDFNQSGGTVDVYDALLFIDAMGRERDSLDCLDASFERVAACGPYDLDGSGLLISQGDLAVLRLLNELPVGPSALAPVCGNGYVEPAEECDDANTESGDGCSERCNHGLLY